MTAPISSGPVSSFSGLVSGFDFQALVTQIISLESRPATVARNSITQINSKLTAIKTYRGLLNTLTAAATTLRDGSAFDNFDTKSSILLGDRNLAQIAATATAQPARYELEVSSLARAEKLASVELPSASADLGYSGSITLNGKLAIPIAATDNLADIRDRINAANTGTDPTHVTASILTVSPTINRLVLTSDNSGLAGLTLADTTGNTLQSLGFLTAPTVKDPDAVQVAGADAVFKIDGIPFVRSSNTVTDAISGVTLSLTNTEAGAVTSLEVTRSNDAARGAAQGFVDSYNKVIDFLKVQSTITTGAPNPVLFGDPAIRSAKGSLPSALLQTVLGAAKDMNTAGGAGLTLSRDGKLALDATKFDAAFTGRLADLRTLFMRSGTSTDPRATFVAASTDTAEGTYAVDITAAATQAAAAGTGFSGTYADDATADTLTVTDTGSGKQAQVALASGMTTAQIVSALNTAFGASSIGIIASATGGQLTLTHASYGSGSGFSISMTGGGADGTAQLGLTTGTLAGIDVAGTIGGEAATGVGQLLTAASGTPKGLTLMYTGTTAAGAFGSVTTSFGTGALIERQLASWADLADGTLTQKETALADQSASLDSRATRIEGRMVRRRAALLAQFQRMESTISRLQSQSSSLIASLGSG